MSRKPFRKGWSQGNWGRSIENSEQGYSSWLAHIFLATSLLEFKLCSFHEKEQNSKERPEVAVLPAVFVRKKRTYLSRPRLSVHTHNGILPILFIILALFCCFPKYSYQNITQQICSRCRRFHWQSWECCLLYLPPLRFKLPPSNQKISSLLLLSLYHPA